MRDGGGWIGYAASTGLVALVTEVLAIPIFLIFLIFGLLVITKTPLSKVLAQIGKLFSLGRSGISNARARRAERLVDEDFEVSESPPFESPLVKDLVQEFEPQQLDYEVELEDFDEITQEVPKISKPVKSETTRPQQLLLSSDAKYELPPADLLRGGPASKGKSNPGDTAIFYRTNAQSRVFEEVFMRIGIPYKVVGGVRFYERKEIKDFLAYLRVVVNPEDEVSLRRIINTPKRGIGDRALDLLDLYAKDNNLTFWQSLCEVEKNQEIAQRSSLSLIEFVKLIQSLQTL